MKIEKTIHSAIIETLKELYNVDAESDLVQLQKTRKDFEGDITLVVFPFLKYSKKSPEETAAEVGEHLKNNVTEIVSYNVVKGFLNLVADDKYWVGELQSAAGDDEFGEADKTDTQKLVMVEYSSPNTNKPLHLGHIRNNLLGFSISEILKANNYKVVKTNIVNDRGIHICKSMLAWQKWGDNRTPENTGIKGDHLVGDLYVEFDTHYKQEVAELIEKGHNHKEAEELAPTIVEARELLRKWELGDPEVVNLWKTMNNWVYKGFDVTYKRLGVDFDKIYYESDTYLVGKERVLQGLKDGIFYQKEDGSVWIDLTNEGLDHKLLLRSDGTSVYMTQDIGTAKLRFSEFPIDKMIYVVGNEQNYHFQVLAVILDKLGYDWGKGLYHFSYGMVELPTGKMKSREGSVVDADDLMDDMIEVARKMAEELGKLDALTKEESEEIYEIIALGALKYFMLKVDPKKNMLFNPEESIDFNGNTGPFIQYTHARIQSVLRKSAEKGIKLHEYADRLSEKISAKEKELIKQLLLFEEAVREAGINYSPALIANYCYELAREYNQFYHDHHILGEKNADVRNLRLLITVLTGRVIKKGMKMLGIEVPDRM